MHSSFALLLAYALTFAGFAFARVPDQQNRVEGGKARRGFLHQIRDVFKVATRQDQVCVEDDIYQALVNDSNAQPFCSQYLSLAPVTVVTQYTPTV